MIRLLAILAIGGVLQLSTGCRHVGGECDCAPVPGDSVGINPHIPGYGANTLPPSINGTFEPIAPPKTTPPLR